MTHLNFTLALTLYLVDDDDNDGEVKTGPGQPPHCQQYLDISSRVSGQCHGLTQRQFCARKSQL